MLLFIEYQFRVLSCIYSSSLHISPLGMKVRHTCLIASMEQEAGTLCIRLCCVRIILPESSMSAVNASLKASGTLPQRCPDVLTTSVTFICLESWSSWINLFAMARPRILLLPELAYRCVCSANNLRTSLTMADRVNYGYQAPISA